VTKLAIVCTHIHPYWILIAETAELSSHSRLPGEHPVTPERVIGLARKLQSPWRTPTISGEVGGYGAIGPEILNFCLRACAPIKKGQFRGASITPTAESHAGRNRSWSLNVSTEGFS
jgi:hypothetical protein